ncbi:MAG: reverse transcriptase family protein [Planctomycetota bacterium]|nr:reverse transcriptase family protein [Planctomycetota bacterium]MDA1213678.1 reverse transcriptase family protein [Planctomycetota bacterium]
MGLFDFLFGWLFRSSSDASVADSVVPAALTKSVVDKRGRAKLVPLRYQQLRQPLVRQTIAESPYAFARLAIPDGGYQDLSSDSRHQLLDDWQLPRLETPADLAMWLQIPLGQLAWLIHRFHDGDRPPNERESHYRYHWIKKRRGGYRLIEAPKPILHKAQSQLLEQILNRVPLHVACQGFTTGRSIVTNAKPHVGQTVVLKFDLENFYPNVTFSRVVALFRGLGYNREISTWLGRLATSCVPSTMGFPKDSAGAFVPYLRRHLPQGAPTSPMLANLAAFSLDIRLFGLARSFGANYTRYADDLTFSGPASFERGLKIFIPLVTQVIRDERFRVHKQKRKILRQNSRQTVTGVVVNQNINISRQQYDSLKAILTNCVRHGPATQNRLQHPDFASHLRGKIAYVQQLNPSRGSRLWTLFNQIRW